MFISIFWIFRIILRRTILENNCRQIREAQNVRHRQKRQINIYACTAQKKCQAWTLCNNISRQNIVSNSSKYTFFFFIDMNNILIYIQIMRKILS